MKKLMFLAFASVFLVACGGSGSGNNNLSTPPLTATGILKDANVVGIEYVSGSQSGTTTMAGEFTYEVGQNTVFSIGNITIGSTTIDTAQGTQIITPIDLFPGSSASSPTVRNIVRFLLTLDSDQNPDNGINIDTQTLTDATSWTGGAINFSDNNFGSNTEVTNFLAQIGGVGTTTLAATSTAQSHLVDTLRCSYAGGYQGVFVPTAIIGAGEHFHTNDDDNIGISVGNLFNNQLSISLLGATRTVFLVNADGTVRSYPFNNEVSSTIQLNRSLAFFEGNNDIEGGTLEGVFYDFDNLAVEIDDNNSPSCGTLGAGYDCGALISASRIGGNVNAKYRFTALASPITSVGTEEYGILTFDIGNNNLITGLAYSLVDNATFALSGTYTMDNQLLEVEIEQNDAFTTASATINLNTGVMSNGMWNDGDGESGVLVGSGCRLN